MGGRPREQVQNKHQVTGIRERKKNSKEITHVTETKEMDCRQLETETHRRGWEDPSTGDNLPFYPVVCIASPGVCHLYQ